MAHTQRGGGGGGNILRDKYSRGLSQYYETMLSEENHIFVSDILKCWKISTSQNIKICYLNQMYILSVALLCFHD